jgi:hypothetical protein
MISKLTSFFKPESAAAEETDTLWTTPWAWRDEEDVYFGHRSQGGQVWLYRALPVSPVEWEDPDTRVQLGMQLANLMGNLGESSSNPVAGARFFSNNREVHLLSITWEADAVAPEGTPERLAEYQKDVLTFTVPHRALLVGVRLRSSARAGANAKVGAQLKSMATKMLAEDVPDRHLYDLDREKVSSLVARYGGRRLTQDQRDQLESWYNMGMGPDATIVEETTSMRISNYDNIEMSAVMRFGRPVMHAPNDQWVFDAITHPDAPRVVSVRGELEPAQTTQGRARRAQRKIKAMMEEEVATGDLERMEVTNTGQQAQALEEFIFSTGEPIVTNCSILMARSVEHTDETYMDFLKERYGIEMKPLEHRQIRALDETLPCSTRRLNPFLQDVSIGMLAHAGLHGFSNVGDGRGAYLGLADPDLTPVFLDPMGAARNDKPPVMLIAGDPGSGKTFTSQSLALQAVLAGRPTIFINPKGFSTLESFAAEVNGSVIKMSAHQEVPGAFDPFSYAPPAIAAEIALTHILSVLGDSKDGFSQAQQLELGEALKHGAELGATCVGECLEYVTDESVKTQIRQQVRANSLFGLGISYVPRERFGQASGLTLIEFDREIGLPSPSKPYSEHLRSEKIALAALRLIIRAAMEILMQARDADGYRGGVLVVDEAWTFLGHSAGKDALDRIGREGRSLNLLPIFATQRISDVIDKDLEGFISRVLVMQMKDEREIRASLKLCGLKDTPARMNWVKNCGPKRGDDETPSQLPMALHRDLYDRHSAVVLGPTPERIAQAFSTNADDARRREEALAAAQTQLDLDNPGAAGAGDNR